ncbi:MAG: hypothetical protein HDS35_07160 [Bacteroides sp.]|nr:hypothetical protein [Bacteroides sp.]
MATLKAVVRKQRADGFYAVYIRIVHRSRMGYIKTDKIISPKNVTANGDLKDPVVNEYCGRMILKYTDMLNRKDLSAYSVAEVIEYLTRDSGVESFSDYARLHIDRMIKSAHGRNAKDYMYALQHLERYLGTNQILFAHLSSNVLKKWIETMSLTNRAKEKFSKRVIPNGLIAGHLYPFTASTLNGRGDFTPYPRKTTSLKKIFFRLMTIANH